MSRGTSFYYSFLVLPRRERQALLAVFDFCRAVDDSVDLTSDRGLAAAGVSRWATELDLVFGAAPPRTPQGRALAHAVAEFSMSRTPFDDLLAGVAMDVRPQPYPTFVELERYCHRVASAVGLMCIEIFGVRHEAGREYATDLGVALQLTNILRDVAADAVRGRVYIPVEDLERFGCDLDDVLSEARRGPHLLESERLRAVLEHQASRARVFFARAARALPRADARRLVAAEIMRAIYWELLRRIEADRCEVFSRMIRVPRPAQARIAVGTWWAIRRGALRR